MLLAALLGGHVLAAIAVAALFSLPFIAHMPRTLRAVLLLLRFAAGLTLLSGSALWIVLKPAHPAWLYLSFALFAIVTALVMFIVSPAAARLPGEPDMRSRVRWTSVVSSALTFSIGVLMVLQPTWS